MSNDFTPFSLKSSDARGDLSDASGRSLTSTALVRDSGRKLKSVEINLSAFSFGVPTVFSDRNRIRPLLNTGMPLADTEELEDDIDEDASSDDDDVDVDDVDGSSLKLDVGVTLATDEET
ncbi:hypothetical protein OGATHE_001482 [Ogataea polymorpha]|uniref:Uncharacterized protein n=1 Tax=Ogataea polymorpha TaxID=460523 RepID=A0A9P8PSV2_9ASCO|nr:hypothetical protein OGATHE_001482 [Ogataea polymorpha]